MEQDITPGASGDREGPAGSGGSWRLSTRNVEAGTRREGGTWERRQPCRESRRRRRSGGVRGPRQGADTRTQVGPRGGTTSRPSRPVAGHAPGWGNTRMHPAAEFKGPRRPKSRHLVHCWMSTCPIHCLSAREIWPVSAPVPLASCHCAERIGAEGGAGIWVTAAADTWARPTARSAPAPRGLGARARGPVRTATPAQRANNTHQSGRQAGPGGRAA